MKKYISLLLLLLPMLSFSQEHKIEKLLNDAMEKELLYQIKNPQRVTHTLIVLSPFKISSKDKVLSFSVFCRESSGSSFEVSQYVALDQVVAISKDGNVFFETKPSAVLTAESSSSTKEATTNDTDKFRLYMAHEKDNKKLQHQLIRAFKKAGYIIEKGIWLN